MTLDDLKRDFIEYMEKATGASYPRNFFGCLTAIIIEEGPTTQDRIIELTGYSKAAVSVALQKIQLALPVNMLKFMGDRKHYYEYKGGPEDFLIDLMRRRVDVADLDLEMVRTFQKKAEMRVTKHPSFRRLLDYFEELGLYLELMYSIRIESLDKFRAVLVSGSFDGVDLPEASAVNSGKLAVFLDNLMVSEERSGRERVLIKDKPPLDYVELKRKYFSAVKTGLNSLYAQKAANLVIILHDVIIERAVTQEMLQESTQLPRSTISDTLTLAVEQGIIEFDKLSGSRTKIYRPAITLTGLILNYYNRSFAYGSNTRKKIIDLVNRMKDVPVKDSKYFEFLEKLNALERAYAIAEEFSIRNKAEFVKELMNKIRDNNKLNW
jgi:DNA-binding transcriptional regulator GbsR (MarR family)